MTRFRDQLQSARAEYQRVQYPGDLAMILPAPRGRMSMFLGRVGAPAGIAAALVLVALGHVMLGSDSLRPPSLAEVTADISPSQWRLPEFMSAPSPAEMTREVGMMAPPKSPGTPSEMNGPLNSSGQSIWRFGKDLVHQADALIDLI